MERPPAAADHAAGDVAGNERTGCGRGGAPPHLLIVIPIGLILVFVFTLGLARVVTWGSLNDPPEG